MKIYEFTQGALTATLHHDGSVDLVHQSCHAKIKMLIPPEDIEDAVSLLTLAAARSERMHHDIGSFPTRCPHRKGDGLAFGARCVRELHDDSEHVFECCATCPRPHLKVTLATPARTAANATQAKPCSTSVVQQRRAGTQPRSTGAETMSVFRFDMKYDSMEGRPLLEVTYIDGAHVGQLYRDRDRQKWVLTRPGLAETILCSGDADVEGAIRECRKLERQR